MKPNVMLGCLLTALTAGEVAGSVLYVLHPSAGIWENALLAHGLGVLGGDFPAVTAGILLYSLLWLILFAAAGCLRLSALFAQLLVFLHGLTLGEKLAFLYRGQVLTGLVTAVLFVMPFALAQTVLFLLAARECMRTLRRQKRLSSGRAGVTERRTYVLRFAVLAVGMLLLALMQGFWMGNVYPACLRRLILIPKITIDNLAA